MPQTAVGLTSGVLKTFSATIPSDLAAAFARIAVSDAAYTVLTTDRQVSYTALTASRTVTLPAASTYPTGATLTIVDESGFCSGTNTIVINRAGTDTINGATIYTISTAYGYVALESNGSGKWTVIDAPGVSTASPAFTGTPTAPTTAAGTNTTQLATTAFATAGITAAFAYTAVSDAAVTATAASRLIAYTALTAARVVTLPAASSFTSGTTLTIVDLTGSCSTTNTLTLTPNGTDKINGASTYVINTAYGYVALVAVSGKWTIIDAPAPSSITVQANTLATSTAAYTLALTDAGCVVEATDASAVTITIPPNSSVAFPINTVLEVFQYGAGQVTIAAGAGVTLRNASSLTTRAQYSTIGLRQRALNEWIVSGDVS